MPDIDRVRARIRYCQVLNLMVLTSYLYGRSAVVVWMVNILVVLVMGALLIILGRKLRPVIDRLGDPLDGTFFAQDPARRTDP